MEEKQVVTGRIENWAFDGSSIIGNVNDDINKRFNDGTLIRTSYVTSDESSIVEGGLVETRNSLYLLGTPISLNND